MKRNIKLLALFNFFTDFVLYAPVAIIYFSQVSGSYASGMSVFSIAMLSSAVFEVPTGIFSDLIGRKNTMVAGAISSVVSVLLYAIGGSYVILAFGAVCEGLGRSFFSGNNDALLHDTLAATNQQHAYHEHLGKLSSLFQVALALSAILGGFIANWSFAWVMWLSIIPKIIMVGLASFLVEPKKHSLESGNAYAHLKEALQQFKLNGKLQLLSITSMLRFALGESAYLFRSAFVATLWPIWAIGFSNFISNVGAAMSFYFSGKLINKFKPSKILTFEIIANRFINLLALLFPSVASPALMGTTSLGYGLGQVATNMLLQKEFSQKQRATMGSLNSLFGSVCFAIVAVGLGFIGDKIGPTYTLILIHLLLFTPLLLYRQIFKHEA